MYVPIFKLIVDSLLIIQLVVPLPRRLRQWMMCLGGIAYLLNSRDRSRRHQLNTTFLPTSSSKNITRFGVFLLFLAFLVCSSMLANPRSGKFFISMWFLLLWLYYSLRRPSAANWYIKLIYTNQQPAQ